MKTRYIKETPLFWNYLPLVHTKMASTIYPNIYFPKKEYADLTSLNPSTWIQSVLIHEEVHLRIQREIGVLKFGFLYLTNKKFRLEQELLAIKDQMIFLKKHGETYDINRKAKQFSGKEYMYLMSFQEAEKILINLWDSL